MINRRLHRLEDEGKPIKVGIVGVGKFGSTMVHQIAQMPGMRVVALADIHPQKAVDAYGRAGVECEDVIFADSPTATDRAIASGKRVVTEDASVVTGSMVDVVVEATGIVESGARVGYAAIQNGKHVVMVNVEADVTVGSALKRLADKAGVVYSIADGDQPGCIKEMVDWAQALGFTIVAAGRGTRRFPFDRTGTPDEAFQRFGFAHELVERWRLNPQMYNSFRDGTKSQIEMTCVANLTGLLPDVRGMHEPSANLADLPTLFRLKEEGGILDRTGVVELANCVAEDRRSELPGGIPSGVFVVITSERAHVRDDLRFYGLPVSPDGRNAVLFRHYHLCGIEAPMSIAKVILFGESTGASLSEPVAECIAVAKRDLRAGETLDGSGGFTVYGLIEKAEIARRERLLPLGLTTGALLTRDVAQDESLTEDMVRFDRESFTFRLRQKSG